MARHTSIRLNNVTKGATRACARERFIGRANDMMRLASEGVTGLEIKSAMVWSWRQKKSCCALLQNLPENAIDISPTLLAAQYTSGVS